MQAMRVGMGVDNFFKGNGHRLRNIAAVVAPYLAAESPALVAGVDAAGRDDQSRDVAGAGPEPATGRAGRARLLLLQPLTSRQPQS